MISCSVLATFCCFILVLFSTAYAAGVCDVGHLLCCDHLRKSAKGIIEGVDCFPLSIVGLGSDNGCARFSACCKRPLLANNIAQDCEVINVNS